MHLGRLLIFIVLTRHFRKNYTPESKIVSPKS